MKKYKGFSLGWVLSIVTITSIISALTTGVIVYNNNKIGNTLSYADISKDESLNQFLEVYAKIIDEYYEDVDKSEMLDKAIAAMMDYLGDDYTNYLNGETTADILNELSGKYTGIGVSINKTTKQISTVYEDTPAFKAGILAGDIIIGVGNQDVKEKSSEEIVALIKANKSTFDLKLERNGTVITVNLKNEEIISPSISYNIIDNTNTGYLAINTFSATLEEQVAKALSNLEAKGITSLIIDVRDNTGGFLDSAEKVSSMFLEKGKRIYSLSNKDTVKSYDDKTNEKRDYDVVILTNGRTASASEILAAALKQSYGATIIGEKSFGKGKVQQTMKLDDGSMVKYTSSYWLMPDGTCIDQVGIKPDIEVSNEEIMDETGNVISINDLQLQKAVEFLTENSN